MESFNQNRRQFLRTTVLGGASTLLATTALAQDASKFVAQDTSKTTSQSSAKPILKRMLGKTGIEVPIVSFGVMRADNPALITEAMKSGMTFFDTAHGYQNGRNEEMLGSVLQNYPRKSFFVATKVGPEQTDNTTGLLGSASTSKAFLEKLDISLKRLKMDYVDILYVHGIGRRESVLHPEMLKAITLAKESGKAKHVGVSTHRNEPDVILAAVESGVYEVVLTSINFMQDHYEAVKQAVAKANAAGVGIVAMKTMAGGFHDKERTKPINCKAALKFVLQDKNVTTAIPGITNFDQLAMNVDVAHDLEMTQEEKNDLAGGKSEGSLYCPGCDHCVSECAKKLPVPDIMRAYMYTYGYRDPAAAQSLLSELQLPTNPCGDCSHCSVKCSYGFSVADRITDVARLNQVPAEFLA